MEPESSASGGFLASLASLSDGLLASVQHRLQLFGVEVQEQKLRLIQTIVWVSAAIFAGVMTLTFASLTLVYLFWATARLAVLGGLTLLYTTALVATLVGLRRHLARQPPPFAATLRELETDRTWIRPGS